MYTMQMLHVVKVSLHEWRSIHVQMVWTATILQNHVMLAYLWVHLML
jgi:hypothetical protein